MQQSVLSVQQLTNILTSHRDNGHYTLIHSTTYIHNGLAYKLNHDPLSKRSSPIRKEIIDRFIEQLHAMLSHYDELFVLTYLYQKGCPLLIATNWLASYLPSFVVSSQQRHGMVSE